MTLGASDYLEMFLRFCVLSLISVGGGITTAPGMHRYLVDERHWLDGPGFTASISLAQAAPGPNILFVAVLGWNAGGFLGACACMAGIMLPASALMLALASWIRANRDSLVLRAFTAGMLPLTLGLMLATGWLLAVPFLQVPGHVWDTVALIVVTVVVALKTRLSPAWLVLGGGLVGLLGFV
ncbi:MAG: chromate transporter [Paucibacter sp.]|nr:chromate transporter [Roseateles sp.]